MVKQKISDIRNKIIPKRRNIKSKTSSNFEDSNKIMKLFLLIVIVNKGQGEAIQNILSKNKVSASFAFHGVGTASKETYLNDLFEDKKTIVMGIISQDDYFKNLPEIPRVQDGYLTDSVEAFHTLEFQQDVQFLLQNGVVIMPRYDVASNTRLSKNKVVRTGQINILEGLHTISIFSKLPNSIKIYLDTNPDVCLNRRIVRDTSKYAIPEGRIREYWEKCILPMCEQFIYKQKQIADIIL